MIKIGLSLLIQMGKCMFNRPLMQTVSSNLMANVVQGLWLKALTLAAFKSGPKLNFLVFIWSRVDVVFSHKTSLLHLTFESDLCWPLNPPDNINLLLAIWKKIWFFSPWRHAGIQREFVKWWFTTPCMWRYNVVIMFNKSAQLIFIFMQSKGSTLTHINVGKHQISMCWMKVIPIKVLTVTRKRRITCFWRLWHLFLLRRFQWRCSHETQGWRGWNVTKQRFQAEILQHRTRMPLY